VSGRCRVGVSRSTKRSGPAGVPAKPVGSSFTSQSSCPSRGRVTPSARCEPAALMKDQCAGCPTRVLANASSQWDALPHVVRRPYRHEAKAASKSIDRADSRDPALGATSWCMSANDGLHVRLPEALGPLMRASFVRTLRRRLQRNPVRFTSYAATTRMRRSRSNVPHSAHGSAYAAGQQHSLPPHTGKVGSALRTGLARPHVRHALRSSFIHRV
jgi:hypothetical protein